MFLNTISIQNFRSISNLKVEDLGQINIFTGENNCGKTTLLEAVFQLVGWHLGSLLQLNSFRSPLQPNSIVSGFFHNMEDNNKIEITGTFEKAYQRILKIYYPTPSVNEFNNSGIGIQSTLSESQKKSKPAISKGLINNGNLVISPTVENPQVSIICSFSNFKMFEHTNLVKSLSEIIKNKQVSKIIDLLKQFDSRIRNIAVVENNILLDLDGFPKLMPIEISGDGLRRILSVLLSIYVVGKGGIVLVDEVENGLHFSTMPKFWRSIINAAKELNVQLFITTHNEELLQSLNTTAQEESYEEIQPKIRYYNLKRYPNDEIVAYKYDFEKFGYLLSNGNEIR